MGRDSRGNHCYLYRGGHHHDAKAEAGDGLEQGTAHGSQAQQEHLHKKGPPCLPESFVPAGLAKDIADQITIHCKTKCCSCKMEGGWL